MARHHGSGTLITNNGRTQFFIQQKCEEYPIVKYRYHFSLFGGGSNAEETPKDTIERELREELPDAYTLLIPRTEIVMAFALPSDYGEYDFSMFQTVLPDSELEGLVTTEIREGRGKLVTREDLLRLPYIHNLELTVRSYLQFH